MSGIIRALCKLCKLASNSDLWPLIYGHSVYRVAVVQSL